MAVTTQDMLAYIRATFSTRLAGRPAAPPPQALADLPSQGCFVSLKTRGGTLRGCIGTLAPARGSLAEELAENAMAAALKDPRFKPVQAHELSTLVISVDLLTPPGPVEDPALLDPRKHGVVVRSGSRCGVLLPDLPGVDTLAQQVGICREKARIPADAPVALECFTVERFGE